MGPDFEKLLEQSIDIWLNEDIGEGDHTTISTIPEQAMGKANLLAKDHGVIAGIFAIEKVIKRFDKNLRLDVYLADGSPVKKGDIVFELSGSVRSILQVERLILNILQRLSGIATVTKKYSDAIKSYKTKILDTRKTTPGLRYLEKEAIRLGGGHNHRKGLFDMILIKDNHIDFAGSIEKAINASREYLKQNQLKLKIEVEARSLKDVEEILNTGHVDRILLDNFSADLTREAVKMIDGKAETESSGGITFERLREYAECGVDFISAGALTHQLKSLDLSLKAAF